MIRMELRDLVILGLCMSVLLAFLLSAACVTATREIVAGLTATPIPTTEPMPEPTHQIDASPVVYIEPEDLQLYRLGKKEMGQQYSWLRYNVSGQKDMLVRVTVYDYLFLSYLTWWSDSNGRYYLQFPEPGKKFLFIFANLYMDGLNQTWDPRYYVGDPWKRWYVQHGQQVYCATADYVPAVRIKELEERFTLFDDQRVRPWGYQWIWRGVGEGWVAESPEWLRMGKSNAWDGYILFQVPINAKPEELKVLSQWDKFGDPWWQLW